MITLRRARERHHRRHRKQETWRTFYRQAERGPLAEGFGALEILNENRLPPGAVVPRHRHRDTEIVTYVREGALAHEDSIGRSSIIHAGEFQRMTAGGGISHSEMNVLQSDWTHVFRIWLRASETGLEPSHEQKRFSAAQRRGTLCLIASCDARCGSLRIHQDALLFSAMLDDGQHMVHELAQGRAAWLHLVQGEVALGDIVLTTGDGAGVTAERSVSLTARESTEILLIDLGELPKETAHHGGVP